MCTTVVIPSCYDLPRWLFPPAVLSPGGLFPLGYVHNVGLFPLGYVHNEEHSPYPGPTTGE